ncbi:MAG: copper chaperone PCu(A)C [Deltaproteobacteria bacterium]|nr:copper chaperone PCu(A)C [Deltaproteobacteria bacterium]
MFLSRAQDTSRHPDHLIHFLPHPKARALVTLVLLALALGTSACGTQESPPPRSEEVAKAAPKLEILQPSAHLMPNMGAVYMTIVNNGTAADRLVRIESPLATGAETHETLEQDGVMRMVPRPEGFEIPAGGTVTLEPSGKHIMLLEPSPAEEGASTLPVTLHFETSGPLEVEARLRALTE